MRRGIFVTAILSSLMMTGQSNAGSSAIPSAYVVAAEDNGIPPEVLYAVASAESVVTLDAGPRPWPWTLNVAGKAMRFGDRASACQALLDALERTSVVDVGIAQINVRWQPHLFGAGQRFADPCVGLDPYANLDEAANLIRQHYNDAGDWLIAAGRYHRPAGGKPAERYRTTVSKVLAQLGGASSIGSASSPLFTAQNAASPTPTGHRATPIDVTGDNDAGVVWITPVSRVPETDLTWVTPAPRRWLAEVASR